MECFGTVTERFGVKSGVLNLVNKCKMKNEEIRINDLACSFQESVVDVLVSKTIRAAKEHNVKHIIVAGGVAANKGLREALTRASLFTLRVVYNLLYEE